MAAVIELIDDPLFEELAEVLLLCSLSAPEGCSGCPHFIACIRWWDNRICTHCEQRLLKQNMLKKYALEFASIQNGTNGHGRYLLMPSTGEQQYV